VKATNQVHLLQFNQKWIVLRPYHLKWRYANELYAYNKAHIAFTHQVVDLDSPFSEGESMTTDAKQISDHWWLPSHMTSLAGPQSQVASVLKECAPPEGILRCGQFSKVWLLKKGGVGGRVALKVGYKPC